VKMSKLLSEVDTQLILTSNCSPLLCGWLEHWLFIIYYWGYGIISQSYIAKTVFFYHCKMISLKRNYCFHVYRLLYNLKSLTIYIEMCFICMVTFMERWKQLCFQLSLWLCSYYFKLVLSWHSSLAEDVKMLNIVEFKGAIHMQFVREKKFK
jgi:hypothetical protein